MNSFRTAVKKLLYRYKPNSVWGVLSYSEPSSVTVYAEINKVIVQSLSMIFHLTSIENSPSAGAYALTPTLLPTFLTKE